MGACVLDQCAHHRRCRLLYRLETISLAESLCVDEQAFVHFDEKTVYTGLWFGVTTNQLASVVWKIDAHGVPKIFQGLFDELDGLFGRCRSVAISKIEICPRLAGIRMRRCADG